jgi:hypothetical protein
MVKRARLGLNTPSRWREQVSMQMRHPMHFSCNPTIFFTISAAGRLLDLQLSPFPFLQLLEPRKDHLPPHYLFLPLAMQRIKQAASIKNMQPVYRLMRIFRRLLDKWLPHGEFHADAV